MYRFNSLLHLWRTIKVTLRHFITILVSIYLLLLQTGCSTLPDAANFPHVPAEPFRFKHEGEAPSYSLQLGDENTSDMVFFFISGSGCASIKHRLDPFFKPIRSNVNAMVFSLQKRAIDPDDLEGSSCSSAFRKTDYIEQTIADQREFIGTQLDKFPVKPKAVVLVGASEGAFVAARIANSDRRITHIGLIGSGGTTMRENLTVLSRSTWYLRNPEKGFAEIAADPDNTDEQIWGHSYKYWASLLDIDIGNELIQLDIPIVAAMGEKDESVAVDSARRMQKMFEQAGKKNLELLVYPDANHRLQSKESSYAGDFLEKLVATIQKTVASENRPELVPD